MNISSTYSILNSSNSTGNESALRQLQSQMNTLQNQIKAESSSKDDTKTKEGKVQLLQVQLVQIQAQMQQIQTKSTTQNVSSGQPTQAKLDPNTISSEQSTQPNPNYSKNIIDVQV